MSQTPVMLAMPEPPEPENIVKRLFKIAEILSRTPTRQNDRCFDDENGFKNRDDREIGYLDSSDHLLSM
jgi:hypothetical protein